MVTPSYTTILNFITDKTFSNGLKRLHRNESCSIILLLHFVLMNMLLSVNFRAEQFGANICAFYSHFILPWGNTCALPSYFILPSAPYHLTLPLFWLQKNQIPCLSLEQHNYWQNPSPSSICWMLNLEWAWTYGFLIYSKIEFSNNY